MRAAALLTPAVLLLFVGCLFPSRSSDSVCTDCNVILISIDTLRADHLGCYGYPHNTSPNIDQFCRRSMVFLDTISQAPQTLPSHYSILSSLYPFEHNNSNNNTILLAELLRAEGYQTAAFVDGGQMSAAFGFDKGFDLYQEVPLKGLSFLNPLILSWLQENYQKPFFLFIHTYDVHDPYFYPEPYMSMFMNRIDPSYVSFVKNKSDPRHYGVRYLLWKNLSADDALYLSSIYDAGISFVDYYAGQIMDFVENHNLSQSTMIILTSDHGESLGEEVYGGFLTPGESIRAIGHEHLLETNLHVPLIIFLPNSTHSGTSSEPTMSIDIVPTILDYLGLPPKEDAEGESLLPLVLGQKSYDGKRLRISETSLILRRTDRLRKAIRSDSTWKYVQEYSYAYGTQHGELFNLVLDPNETNNVIEEHSTIAEHLSETLFSFLTEIYAEEFAIESLDEQTLDELRSLGYLS